MNYFYSKVQEIQPFKNVIPNSLTNVDAMVTAIALPILLYRRDKKNVVKT